MLYDDKQTRMLVSPLLRVTAPKCLAVGYIWKELSSRDSNTPSGNKFISLTMYQHFYDLGIERKWMTLNLKQPLHHFLLLYSLPLGTYHLGISARGSDRDLEITMVQQIQGGCGKAGGENLYGPLVWFHSNA